jgi:hypothetical protein
VLISVDILFSISKIMEKKDIVLVNKHLKDEHVKGSGWRYSSSLEETFRRALDKHGPDAKVVIVPHPGRAAYLSLDQ